MRSRFEMPVWPSLGSGCGYDETLKRIVHRFSHGYRLCRCGGLAVDEPAFRYGGGEPRDVWRKKNDVLPPEPQK